MSTRVKCIVCGKRTRHLDGFCNVHRTLNPEQRHMTETEEIPAEADNKEEKKMKVLKVIGFILGSVVILAIAIIIIWGGALFIMNNTRGNDTIVPAATTTTLPTETTTIVDDADYQVGEPANASDINESVWNEPYADAVMVDANGTSIYTQSGKDDSTTLSGTLPSGVALVIDSYNLTVNGKDYTDGNLLVIVNDSMTTDKDITNYGISYTNGCAQLISISNLQVLLDENISVKFARGDWNKDTNKWSYAPWALTNIWLPESGEYTYTMLTLTYDTDTYPNRDLATDTDVNTSGAVNK